MSTPFIGEIRMFSFNYPPRGWSFCNGQTLAIQQNQALFSILGTTYGGNGVQTFQLPNLQGRSPIHWGGSTALGQVGGEANHTLIITEMPQHFHTVSASTGALASSSPNGQFLTSQVANPLYAPANAANGSTPSLQNNGGSQPHNNMQPYLVVYFCIALVGVFPSRN